MTGLWVEDDGAGWAGQCMVGDSEVNLIHSCFFRIFISSSGLIATRWKLVSSFRAIAMLFTIADSLCKGENHVPRHYL